MKKIILICLFGLMFFSCSGIPYVEELVQQPSNEETVRWIDMDDILEFMLFSESNNVELKDVISYLGEPVYIERTDNGKVSIDLYYKFKSKLYLQFETEVSVNMNKKSYSFGEKNLIKSSMMSMK